MATTIALEGTDRWREDGHGDYDRARYYARRVMRTYWQCTYDCPRFGESRCNTAPSKREAAALLRKWGAYRVREIKNEEAG